jgi:GNAT superfamily N-acetyltransferase
MSRLDVTTDKSRMDINAIHEQLAASYWSPNIPLDTVQRAIENSMCFAGFYEGRLAAFGRITTDTATFAYLSDVFVMPDIRGQGFGKALIAAIMAHADLQGLRRFMLATYDAHDLYRPFGFEPVSNPDILMQIVRETPYIASEKAA